MTPEQKAHAAKLHAEAYQLKKLGPPPQRHCPDCGADIEKNKHRCIDCQDARRRRYDNNRQKMMKEAAKLNKTLKAPAPAKTTAPVLEKATTRPVVTSKPITAETGVKHLQPNRDARHAEADRMDAVIWEVWRKAVWFENYTDANSIRLSPYNARVIFGNNQHFYKDNVRHVIIVIRRGQAVPASVVVNPGKVCKRMTKAKYFEMRKDAA